MLRSSATNKFLVINTATLVAETDFIVSNKAELTILTNSPHFFSFMMFDVWRTRFSSDYDRLGSSVYVTLNGMCFTMLLRFFCDVKLML